MFLYWSTSKIYGVFKCVQVNKENCPKLKHLEPNCKRNCLAIVWGPKQWHCTQTGLPTIGHQRSQHSCNTSFLCRRSLSKHVSRSRSSAMFLEVLLVSGCWVMGWPVTSAAPPSVRHTLGFVWRNRTMALILSKMRVCVCDATGGLCCVGGGDGRNNSSGSLLYCVIVSAQWEKNASLSLPWRPQQLAERPPRWPESPQRRESLRDSAPRGVWECERDTANALFWERPKKGKREVAWIYVSACVAISFILFLARGNLGKDARFVKRPDARNVLLVFLFRQRAAEITAAVLISA